MHETHFLFLFSLFFFFLNAFFMFFFLFLCNSHTHSLFSLYFLGTLTYYITFTKINVHNHNLNTHTTSKINKTPDRKHCRQPEQAEAVAARRSTRLRHWRRVVPRATTRGAKHQGGVDRPLPFLFSPSVMFPDLQNRQKRKHNNTSNVSVFSSSSPDFRFVSVLSFFFGLDVLFSGG